MAPIDPHHGLVVRINSFIDPACVCATEAVHSGMSDDRRKLVDLERSLSKNFRDDKKKGTESLRKVDEVVAVRIVHDHRKWCRGKIKTALQLPTGYKYSVYLTDHGDTVRAKPEQIRDLPYRYGFDSLPPQAMILVLEGIVPTMMKISSAYDSMSQQVSKEWPPAADSFVEEIRQTYKYALFVEDDKQSRQGQTRFGDLHLTLKDSNLVSLSLLLCNNGHAKLSHEDFIHRKGELPTDEFLQDRPSSSYSNLPLNSAARIHKSDAAANSMPTISEFRAKLGKKGENTDTSLSTQESSKSASDTDRDQSTSNRLSLLSKFKKQPAVVTNLPPEVSVNDPIPHQPVRFPSPSRKDLDSRYIPAGRTIRKEKSANSNSKKSTKAVDHGLFESCYFSDPGDTLIGKRVKFQRPVKEAVTSDSSDCTFQTSSHYKRDDSTQEYDVSTTSIIPASLTKRSLQSAESSEWSGSSDASCRSSRLLTLLKTCHTSSSQDTMDCSNVLSQQKPPKPTFPGKSSFLSDDFMKAEDFLTRAVLLHGGFPPSPWITHADLKSKFSSHVEQILMDRKWSYSILTLEKFMWPAIQKRQNVVMVSPPASGKTSSYVVPLMDFMIEAEQTLPGNGPVVLILCAGSKNVDSTYKDCVKLVNGLKKAPRVQKAYGLVIDLNFLIQMVNGCDVFVTTPPCLLRILKDYRSSYALNFKRLCHYVLDQADVLMSKFLNQIREIQAMVVAEQALRTRSEVEQDPIQLIVSSEKWEPQLLSFSTHVLGNPLLCINDCFESCVYGKPDVLFYLTHQDSKPIKLIEILKKIKGLQRIIVFCNENEMPTLEAFLKNECMDFLCAPTGSSVTQLEAILNLWDSSKAGHHYILLCTDSEFDSLKRRNAMSVVHYSLPLQDRSFFVKRLASILDNIPNMFEKETQSDPPAIHLLIDQTNTDQLPFIVTLMRRISNTLDNKLVEAAEVASKIKEKATKVNKLLCKDLKMLGQCLKTVCPSRHVYMPEVDDSGILPKSGLVTVKVVHVHSAAHFSVRLVEHITEDNTKIKWPSDYVKIGFLLSQHFSDSKNQILVGEVSVGDKFAVQTVENLYQRVQVLEITEKNKRGEPISVLVQFLDEGKQETWKVFMLLHLPERLQMFPAQVVDLYLCGLLPADQDDDFGIDATASVRRWTAKHDAKEKDRETHLQGKVMLSMNNSLWVDSAHVMKWLPSVKTNVTGLNIKEELCKQNLALENCDHLPYLLRLCGKDESALLKPAIKSVEKHISQLKPEWAFLECDVFEDIEFICAEDITDVTVFFVQKVKFQPLLNTLVNELNSNPPNQDKDTVLALNPGDICLAQHEKLWFRAQILSRMDDGSTEVFYVDYGNTGFVSFSELACVPDWAVTKLPFQAIECSLAGVSSSDVADRLRDVTDDGAKELRAKVCENKKASLTGGKRFVILLIDLSKPDPSILNKDLLLLEGVKPCQDELNYLNFDIDISLLLKSATTNDVWSDLADDSEYEDLNLTDLDFKNEDLCDEDDRFEVCGIENFMDDFMEANPNLLDNYPGAKGVKPVEVCEESKPSPSQLKQRSLLSKLKGSNVDKCEKDMKAKGENLSDWEEEQDRVHRFRVPALCCARQPQTKWLEDLYYVWIKICLSGVEKYCLQWTYNFLQFSTIVGGRIYYLNQELHGIILPDRVQSTVKGFIVEIKMKKACSGVFWGKPFAGKRRFPWLSRDLDAAAVESSDSACEFSLEAVNKEIKKVPVNLRRKVYKKEIKSRPIQPDLNSDSDGSTSQGAMIDSDEMF